MAQLITIALIVTGLLIIVGATFLAFREERAQGAVNTAIADKPAATIATQPTIATPSEASSPQPESKMPVSQAAPSLSGTEKTSLENMVPSTVWWREQFQDLTGRLRDLRQQSRVIERQLTLLTTMAECMAELDDLRNGHNSHISPEESLLSLRNFSIEAVNRGSMELLHPTEKRPAVRKYTIMAM